MEICIYSSNQQSVREGEGIISQYHPCYYSLQNGTDLAWLYRDLVGGGGRHTVAVPAAFAFTLTVYLIQVFL